MSSLSVTTTANTNADHVRRPEVPAWNGEYQTLRSYTFEVRMYIKGFKKTERYTCAPNLIRGLGPKPKAYAELYEDLDNVDAVSGEGVCTGWNTFFAFLLEKMNLNSLQDIGEQSEHFLLKLKRSSGESGASWVNRFEKSERELLELLKSLDAETSQVLAAPLKAWWLLRRSGLTAAERSQILASTGNKYDYEKITEALKIQYTPDVAQEHDRIRRPAPGKNYYEEEVAESEVFEPDVADDEQVLALASSEDEGADLETIPDVPFDEAIFEATEAARNFKTARNLLRKLKVARDYYPVVVAKDEKGKSKGKGKGKRDYSKMKCLGCGRLGHPVRNCPERRPPSSAAGSASAGVIYESALNILEEYAFLLGQKPGVWAILDTGATRSVGGVPAIEKLQETAVHEIGRDITVCGEGPKFTFGNGQQKSALSMVSVPVYLAAGETEIPIAVIDADVPILIGMDLLRDRANAIIDCGRGWIAIPDLSDQIYKCERLPGGHLAVCLTDLQWWPAQAIGARALALAE